MSRSRTAFVSVDDALLRLNQRNAEAMRAAEELRSKCRALRDVVPREEKRTRNR
jgi:hypothetical protein